MMTILRTSHVSRCLLVALLAITLAQHARADSVRLTGTVVDAAGTPLPGVRVSLQGLNFATYTGPDGTWRIIEGAGAMFPERYPATDAGTVRLEGQKVVVTPATRTSTYLTIAKPSGPLVRYAHHFTAGEPLELDLAAHADLPEGSYLLGVRTDGGLRAVYPVQLASKQFNPSAGDGVVDVLLIDDSRFQKHYVPLKSLSSDVGVAKLTPRTGREVHVDAVKGDDAAADGSSDKPFKTIAKALPTLVSGDTVLLHDGKYDGFVGGVNAEEKAVDMFDDWVTFKPAPGAKPQVGRIEFGRSSPAFWADRGANWEGVFDAHVRLDSLHLTDGVGMSGARNVHVVNCLINREGDLNGSTPNMHKSGVAMRASGRILIDHCEITHCAIGVGLHGNSIALRNNNIHRLSHDGISITGGRDLLIEGNSVHNLEDGADDSERLSWNRHCDGVHLFTEFANDDPAMAVNDLIFRGNRIYHTESMGVMMQAKTQTQLKRFLFENNVFAPSPGFMFHFKDSIQGMVFRHNSFVYAPGTTFDGLYRTIVASDQKLALPTSAKLSRNIQIYNNILCDLPAFQPNGAGLTRYDHNLIYLRPNHKTRPDGKNPLSVDVPYLNPTAFDGVLKPGSEAIGIGATDDSLTALRYDIHGRPRGSKPSVGAWEGPATATR